MVMAIDEIAAIVERGRPAFDDDVVLRRAVERCLEIIGEAAKSVSPPVTEAHPEIPSPGATPAGGIAAGTIAPVEIICRKPA
jgi:uncharacterized protein with HEPN domain